VQTLIDTQNFDGDPIAVNHNRQGLKKQPKHSARMGGEKRHKPHMGGRDGAYNSGDE